MSRSTPQEKGIYLFVIEPDKEEGCREDYIEILSTLLTNKIFDESEDVVCVYKPGVEGSLGYGRADWEMLKELNKERETVPGNPSTSGSAFIQDILDQIEMMGYSAANDVFEAKKVLIFGNFDSFELKAKDLKALRDKVSGEEIWLTLVFPNENEMNALQKENFQIAKGVLEDADLGISIYTVKETLGKVLNLLPVKNVRTIASKLELEIGEDLLKIPVRKLILARKEEVWKQISSKSVKPQSSAKSAVKEVKWLDEKKQEVDASDVTDAYVYGERYVTIEERPYESGDMCLRLLVFSPKDNIHPAYLLGDGADIILPQLDSLDGVKKFYALLEAMEELKVVAVCRRVLRKNARLSLVVLAPDIQRKGLISVDLCFADDVSIPSFPPLIKPGEEDEPLTEKDHLIDELIDSMSSLAPSPGSGPIDPCINLLRQYVAQKVIHGKDAKVKLYDNIRLCYGELPENKDLVDKLKAAFPLEIKKESGAERPSGENIFRKRKNENGESSTDKKVKTEEESTNGGDGVEIESQDSFEELNLDDL